MMVERFLNSRGALYKKVNIREDEAAFDRLQSLRDENNRPYRGTPVLERGTKHLYGFNPTAIAELITD